MYMNEFCFRVLTAITSDLPTVYPSSRNNSDHAIDGVETETVVQYKAQRQHHSYSLIMKKLPRFT